MIKSGDYSTSFNPFVFKEVSQGSTCLDVGCWNGNLGRALIKEKGCVVDGIDLDGEVLKKAKKHGYRKTYALNLNNENPEFKKINNKYDIIIFADVLEHLIDPTELLLKLKENLNPEGKIIISLPNVAFILNRILLLLGRWDYREFGTLDKTHLRFYTIKSVVQMVESAGFKVIKVKPYNQFGLLRYLNPITSVFPTLFSYQILLVAQKG